MFFFCNMFFFGIQERKEKQRKKIKRRKHHIKTHNITKESDCFLCFFLIFLMHLSTCLFLGHLRAFLLVLELSVAFEKAGAEFGRHVVVVFLCG